MKSLRKNTFTIRQIVHLGDTEQRSNAFRWLNYQYTKKELVPLNKKITEAHKDASYALVRCRMVDLTFKIDKSGSWKLIKAKLI